MSVVYIITTAVFILIVSAMVPLVLLHASRPEPQLADPARVRQLEYELDLMDDAERELHEYAALQRRTRFSPPIDRPGEVIHYRGGRPVWGDGASTLVPRSPFYRDPNGGTYVVNEDATGMWHEYSDGRRVFVRVYNEHR